MSFSTDWDIDSYKDDHESDEQWLLRRHFMERWKKEYPEERLVCLARVFTNIELLGCRYPNEVMLEVSRLSEEIAKSHREKQKTKLQRTFVSASDAAEDRAKGVKRVGGALPPNPAQSHPNKSKKIAFVSSKTDTIDVNSSDENEIRLGRVEQNNENNSKDVDLSKERNDVPKMLNNEAKYPYLERLNTRNNHNPRNFRESMFDTKYGRLVLIARQWVDPITNLTGSCSACRIPCIVDCDGSGCSIVVGGTVVSRVAGPKSEARPAAGKNAWEKVMSECITVLGKEAIVAQNSSTISNTDVNVTDTSRVKEADFGTPISCDVASKMMKMMGWSGGALGAKAEGISEPIMPHLQQIRREGLGSSDQRGQSDLRFRARNLMRRFANDNEVFDVDLVFATDFSKEERALLHTVAKQCGLVSKSYGKDNDRFLVVRKKLDPFNLVRGLVQKGGSTAKYQVFIPQN